MIEGGMQNSGLALGIIAVQFNADLGMVIIASLWGIWHIVSGLTLGVLWRTQGCSTGSLKAAPSSTAAAARRSAPTSACSDGRIVEVGRITGAGARTRRRRRRLGDAGLRRHPHPLRRPGHLGRDLLAEHPPWRDDGGDGQLRRRLRAGAPGPSKTELIKLMEGVEDIPGAALAEGIRWNWESFPQYMDALDAHAAQPGLPGAGAARPGAHGGDGRARLRAGRRPTADDIAAMRALVREALLGRRGGLLSTGRSDNHRTSEARRRRRRKPAPPSSAASRSAFEGLQHGVIQMVSDFDLLRGPERFDAEFDLVEAAGARLGPAAVDDLAAARPGRRAVAGIRERVDCAVAAGLPLYLQTAARGIGVIIGLDASFHPFMGFPGFKEIAALPLAARAAALREPAAQGAHAGREVGRRSPATARRSRRWSTCCWRGSS